MTFFMGIASGSSVLSAQEYGRKNIEKMKRLTATAIRCNMLIAFIFFFISTFFPSEVLGLYTNHNGIIQKGVEYIQYMKFAIPLYAITSALISMLQAAKNVKLGLINTMVSCFVNAGLNYVLIFGHFGFPALGLKGAAIATLIARIAEFIVCIVYVFMIEKDICFQPKDFFGNIDRQTLKNLLKVTLPIVAIEVLGNLVSSVQTSLTGHISRYYIAANSIVHTAWVIPSTLSFGISMAAGVMIGNTIGEGIKEKVFTYANRFVVFSFIFGIFNSVVLMFILPVIMSFYNVSTETLELTVKMGSLALITVFFISVAQIVCNGVIKASGQTEKLLKIDIISNWLIAIPFGYFAAFVLKVPVHYLYLILRSGNIFKSLWGIWKVRQKNWV